MLPTGRGCSDDEVDLAAAILIPAVTSGLTRLQLRGVGAVNASEKFSGLTLDVFEGSRIVARIQWSELHIEARPLRRPEHLLSDDSARTGIR